MILPPGQNLRLLVKFQDRLKARADGAGGLVVRADGEERIGPLAALVRGERMRFVPALTGSDTKLEALRERAALRTGIESADLAGLMEVVVDASVARGPMIELAASFHNLTEVEYAQLESLDQPPPPPATDIAPPTDLLVWSQTYRNEDGINVDAIWTSYGVRGNGVRFSDCEYQFNPAHEDLAGQVTLQAGIASMYEAFGSDHGTAALGIVAAAENAYGMTGLAPGATHCFYPEYAQRINGTTQGRDAAVIAALSDSEPGDVVMLEMQASGPGGATKYVPAEYSQSLWNAVKTGTDSGIIVVAAAGNGGENLDSAAFSAYLARGDSGAILVGAGNAARERLSFSTYGGRVNLQGRGEAVATLGYGNLAKYGGDANQTYTGGFNATSSATPVVAGAVVLVQALARETVGRSLTPVEMRQLLIDTGRAQAGGSHIGPVPDMPAAFAELYARFPLNPATPLLISTDSLANGQGGSTYSQTLAATGGVAPYVWTITNGALPAGLTLATNGTLSGTPTAFGSFSFTAQVTDNASVIATKAFAMFIIPAPPAVTLVGSTLTVTFGGGDDIVSFNFALESPTLLIKYQVAGVWTPLSPLLLAGNPINMSAITKWVIDFGNGNDRLDEPSGRVPDLCIYGGAGNDVIKAPPGDGSTRIYGGTGNDQLNAEHAQDNWLYGEGGNDSLWGSSDGLNYLDGGPGNNSLYSSPNTARPPYDAITTLVYHQGSTGFWSDLGANSSYQFISDGSSATGSLAIYDSDGNGPTTDVLDFSRWNYAVSVNPAITMPQIVSVNNLSQPILTLSLLGGSFEQVIQPLDANANTIPDTWEVHYFGGTDSPNGAASFDPDGDGVTNLEEYLEGTSPIDSASKLQLVITSVTPGGAVLQFPTVAGRIYTVEYSDTLAPGSWTILAPANNPGTGGQLEMSDPNMPAKRFYRLTVLLP